MKSEEFHVIIKEILISLNNECKQHESIPSVANVYSQCFSNKSITQIFSLDADT